MSSQAAVHVNPTSINKYRMLKTIPRQKYNGLLLHSITLVIPKWSRPFGSLHYDIKIAFTKAFGDLENTKDDNMVARACLLLQKDNVGFL
jgi:hypothetical protein